MESYFLSTSRLAQGAIHLTCVREVPVRILTLTLTNRNDVCRRIPQFLLANYEIVPAPSTAFPIHHPLVVLLI